LNGEEALICWLFQSRGPQPAELFHSQVHIASCAGKGSGAPILIDPTGQCNSALCQESLTKFAIKRANGQSLAAPDMQLITTRDGIVVGANFNVQ
jgi:hypothetical protein